MERITGLIIKAISGFYYVEAADAVYECKARGIFRKRGISPAVGDQALISIQGEDKAELEDILPRKNYLVRPPLANLDRLFIISSVSDPAPNLLMIDKISAVAFSKGIEPVIVFTKADLADSRSYEEIYRQAGLRVLCHSIHAASGQEEIFSLMKGKISAFTGNTGVGKSSLLNALFPELQLATAEVSKKLGRGRHTTRHTQLYSVGGGYVADTPGFSTVDIERYEKIPKEALAGCFPEFAEYIGQCRFTGCSHRVEKGCAVLEAVSCCSIPASRHRSYVQIYNEVKDIPQWKMK